MWRPFAWRKWSPHNSTYKTNKTQGERNKKQSGQHLKVVAVFAPERESMTHENQTENKYTIVPAVYLIVRIQTGFIYLFISPPTGSGGVLILVRILMALA